MLAEIQISALARSVHGELRVGSLAQNLKFQIKNEGEMKVEDACLDAARSLVTTRALCAHFVCGAVLFSHRNRAVNYRLQNCRLFGMSALCTTSSLAISEFV